MKKIFQRGGHGPPRAPPGYAPVPKLSLENPFDSKKFLNENKNTVDFILTNENKRHNIHIVQKCTFSVTIENFFKELKLHKRVFRLNYDVCRMQQP